jgi:cellulose 1,4-beta-cellobiosidase
VIISLSPGGRYSHPTSDVRAKVPIISTFAKDVQKQNAAGANLVLPLVVYDLPERDCAALSSNGELSLAKNGTLLYQEYIDNIAAQIKAFPDVTFLLVIGELSIHAPRECC